MGFYRDMERDFGRTSKYLLKSYSNILNSYTRAVNSKSFLIECRRNRFTPTFIKNRTQKLCRTTFDNFVQHRTAKSFNREMNRKLLNIMISSSYSRMEWKKKQLEHIRQQLNRILPQHILNEFIHKQKCLQHTIKSNYNRITTKKLQNIRQVEEAPVPYDRDWFVNDSKTVIPDECQSLLALGPKFAVKHEKSDIPVINVIADIENLAYNVEDQNQQSVFRGKSTTVLTNFIRTVKTTENSEDRYLHKQYKKTKTFLKTNNNIVLVEADKGSTTIALDRVDYNKKMLQILNDTSKYRLLLEDPTQKLQQRNNILVTRLFDQRHINQKQKLKLSTYTAQAPKPYAVIKLHKHGHPFRLINASVGTPAYFLSKFLKDICQQMKQDTNYNVKNSFELKEILQTIKLSPDETIASLDIVAMYDNIPTNLVYRSINKRWSKIEDISSIPKKMFFELIRFCITESNYTQFQNNYYRSRTGLAIGGCVSPILADFVVSDLIEEAICELSYDPLLLVKYVDDILLIAPQDELEDTLTIFNNVNSHIKFTIEYENNNCIPYLDMTIIHNEDGSISTNFFQKPTHKGRILNFKSNHPYHQRINTARNFVNRIFSLSSQQFWKQNIGVAVNILRKNSYPDSLIKSVITDCFKSKFILSPVDPETNLNTENNPKLYISCNYVNGLSENISKLFKKFTLNHTIALKSNKNIKQLHNPKKDPIPTLKKSGLIYAMDCNDCEKVYVGQTGQFLVNRMYQHKNDYKNREKLKNKHHSAAVEHALTTRHSFNYDNPTILHSEQQKSKRNTIEMIYIKKFKEKAVNIKSDTEKLSSTYSHLILDNPNNIENCV